jgi:hypothetical protein
MPQQKSSQRRKPGQEADLWCAANSPRTTVVREVWEFVVAARKWWMLPIFAALALFAAFVLLAGSPAGPFIYSFY